MWVLPFSESSVAVPALMVIWVRNVSIDLDIYMRHITHCLEWHKPPTKTPEETRGENDRRPFICRTPSPLFLEPVCLLGNIQTQSAVVAA